MDMARQLLEQLLKKYESSKAFAQESVVRRRILINCYEGEFKPYDYEDYEQKIAVHTVVQDLKKDGLVDFSWVRGEEQHILHRVWLNLDRLDQAYDRAGLVSPKTDAQAVLVAVNSVREDWLAGSRATTARAAIAWIGPFLDEVRDLLTRRQRLMTPLPTARDQALLLLEAIRLLIRLAVAGQTELAERIFSLQAYGDSKTFEQQVRPRLCSVLRRYLLPGLLGDPSSPPDDFEITDDELLSLIGLVRAPEIFEFSGPLLASRRNRQLDFSFFPACATLSSAELGGLCIDLPPVIRRILFVENRTNFHWLVQRRSQNEDWIDTLIVYHGGCFSPAKGQFFQKLKDAVARTQKPADSTDDFLDSDPKRVSDRQPVIEINHWGDIDLGGFLIFNRLKRAFFPQLIPWHMDRSDLLSNIGQAQPISRAYADRLRRLLADDCFSEFHPVIGLMLEKGVRLEQEALLGQL